MLPKGKRQIFLADKDFREVNPLPIYCDIITFFRKISGFLGIQFVLGDTITGNKYNKETVEKALRDLRPDPNDIVVFYYTGYPVYV